MSYNRFLRIPRDPQHCGPIPENCDKNIRLATDKVNVLYVKRDRLRPLPRVTLDIFALEPAGPKFIKTVTLDEGDYEYKFNPGGGIFFAQIKPDCNYTAPVIVASGLVPKPGAFEAVGQLTCLDSEVRFEAQNEESFKIAQLGLDTYTSYGWAVIVSLKIVGGSSQFAALYTPVDGYKTNENTFLWGDSSMCALSAPAAAGTFTFQVQSNECLRDTCSGNSFVIDEDGVKVTLFPFGVLNERVPNQRDQQISTSQYQSCATVSKQFVAFFPPDIEPNSKDQIIGFGSLSNGTITVLFLDEDDPPINDNLPKCAQIYTFTSGK